MALIVDARERKLIKLFAADQIVVETLDVGDILCKYEDGSGWIAERKTAGTFVLYSTLCHTLLKRKNNAGQMTWRNPSRMGAGRSRRTGSTTWGTQSSSSLRAI